MVATATDLTSAYGGTFSVTWSVALKGFRLHATEAQAIAMSGDSQVAFIVQDGAIAVGTPDAEPIAMTPDPDGCRTRSQTLHGGSTASISAICRLTGRYGYHNDGEGVNAYVIDTGILPTH